MLSDEGRVLPWNYGHLFTLRLSANFVRVSPRGVQFSSMATLSLQVAGGNWTRQSCEPTSNALCREGPGLVLFPDTVVDVPYDYSQIWPSKFMERFPTGACKAGDSGRAIAPADRQYEVSLCDLMQANLDVILDTTSDTLFWRVDSTSWLEYVGVSIVSVYLISCLSSNVIKLARDEAFVLSWAELAVLVGTIVYVIIQLASPAGGLQALVTDNDKVLATWLLAYLIVETTVVATPLWSMLCLPDMASDRPVSGVSLYTAAVMLLTMRVHYTFDNPYTGVLAILFGTRSFVKLFTGTHWLLLLVVAVDFATFCAVLALGVGPASTDEFEGYLAQATVVVTSVLLAVVFEIKERGA